MATRLANLTNFKIFMIFRIKQNGELADDAIRLEPGRYQTTYVSDNSGTDSGIIG